MSARPLALEVLQNAHEKVRELRDEFDQLMERGRRYMPDDELEFFLGDYCDAVELLTGLRHDLSEVCGYAAPALTALPGGRS